QSQLTVLQRSIDIAVFKKQYYSSRLFTNDQETLAMQLSANALLVNAFALPMEIGSAIGHIIPSFSIGLAGFGVSPTLSITFGGENIAGSLGGFAGLTHSIAGLLQQGASMASTLGSYHRRQDDWDFQATMADMEHTQLDAQMEQAKIRVAVAQ